MAATVAISLRGKVMSVWVHKGDESQLIDPLYLASSLKAGWSTKKGETNDLRNEEKTGKLQEEKADEGLEEDALRARAKSLKIKGWHLMGVDKLKEAIANAD